MCSSETCAPSAAETSLQLFRITAHLPKPLRKRHLHHLLLGSLHAVNTCRRSHDHGAKEMRLRWPRDAFTSTRTPPDVSALFALQTTSFWSREYPCNSLGEVELLLQHHFLLLTHTFPWIILRSSHPLPGAVTKAGLRQLRACPPDSSSFWSSGSESPQRAAHLFFRAFTSGLQRRSRSAALLFALFQHGGSQAWQLSGNGSNLVPRACSLRAAAWGRR